MAWLVALRTRPADRPEGTLVAIFVILFGSMIASAIAGVVHMRRKDSEIIDGSMGLWHGRTAADNIRAGRRHVSFA